MGSLVGVEPKPDVDPSRAWPMPTKSSKRLVDGSPNWIPVPNAEGPGAMLSMPIQLHGLSYTAWRRSPLTPPVGPGRPRRPRVAQADPADRPLPAWPPPLPHDPHRAELALPAVADQDLLLPLPPRPARGPPWRPLHRSTLKCCHPLGSAPARLLRLLRARLAAPGSAALPGRGRSTGRPATASVDRARPTPPPMPPPMPPMPPAATLTSRLQPSRPGCNPHVPAASLQARS